MKFINASFIIFTSLVITSDIFADAEQQLRGHRGLVENEDVLVSFVTNDTTNTGEMKSISKVEDMANPALLENTKKTPNQGKEAAVLVLDSDANNVVPPNLRRATLVTSYCCIICFC